MFNPIFEIHFDRSTWEVIDAIVAIILLWFILTWTGRRVFISLSVSITAFIIFIGIMQDIKQRKEWDKEAIERQRIRLEKQHKNPSATTDEFKQFGGDSLNTLHPRFITADEFENERPDM